LETARKLGVSLQTLKLPGIGLDIDTPEDLLELCRQPSSDVSTKQTQVQKYLQKQKILERLNNV
jgi:2-phospho-L-lactate guanylyltransferase (CobY/MobA/RfbA family)